MSNDVIDDISKLGEYRKLIKSEVAKVVVGQDSVIDLMLNALFTGGHALLVGVPGLAKTTLVKSLANATGLNYNRIQFTPDLMPSDITGSEILEEEHATGKRIFKYIKGPVFCNLLLADEINRTPPKTQAALLQAMQEHYVTAGGEKHLLDEPFVVFATQNPIEQEGTYTLPEAQLDRFMFFIEVEYPNLDEEINIVKKNPLDNEKNIKSVITKDKILEIKNLIDSIPVADHIIKYAVDIVRATRPENSDSLFIKENVKWGAGPRASQFIISAAKAKAALNGRFAVEITDVQSLLIPILSHRILVNFHGESNNVSSANVIEHLLKDIEF